VTSVDEAEVRTRPVEAEQLQRPASTRDCLFPGGVGNTQQDAERFSSLPTGVRPPLWTEIYATHPHAREHD